MRLGVALAVSSFLLTAIFLESPMFATAAHAQVTSLPINKCLSGKIQGVGKSLAARIGCVSEETRTGILDPSCEQKASDKFTGGVDPANGVFNSLDTKYPLTGTTPCLTYGDQNNFESDISGYVASVPAATGSAVGKCDAAKIKCVGKYIAAVAKCDGKAAAKTGTIDTACTDKAAAKLADGTKGCLDKAALGTNCTYVGSQAVALQEAADMFVQDAVCALAPGNAGCATPTATPTDTATLPPTSTPTATATPKDTPTQTPTSTLPPSKLAFASQPSNTVSTGAISPAITVQVQDAGGNLVTSSTASITIAIGNNPGGGTLSGTTTVSAVGGVATFSNLSIDKAGTGYTLTASSGGLTSATSNSFNITVGPATKLAIVQQPAATTTAGIPIQGASGTPSNGVVVQVQDAGGNLVTSSSGTITLASSPSVSLVGNSVSAVSGVAKFPALAITTAGVYSSLTASSSGLTAATSSGFTIVADVASQLSFVAFASLSQNSPQPIPLQVSVEDQFGNIVTSSSASVTLGAPVGCSPSVTILGTTSTNASGGMASFSNIAFSGPATGCTITASSGGLSSATSALFNIPGPATQLSFRTQPSNITRGASFSPFVVVEVEDANGALVTTSSASISMTIVSTGFNVLTGNTTESAVGGVATFIGLGVSFGNGNENAILEAASFPGLTPADSSRFTIN